MRTARKADKSADASDLAVSRSSAKAKMIRPYVGWIVSLGVILYMGKVGIENWPDIVALPMDPLFLVAHVLLLVASFGFLLWGWMLVLRAHGTAVSAKGAGSAWLLANAGKYVPGKVLMFGGRIWLLQRAGCSVSHSIKALVAEHFLVLLAALPYGLFGMVYEWKGHGLGSHVLVAVAAASAFVLVWWPRPFFWAANLFWTRTGRPPLVASADRRWLTAALGIYLLAWLLYGLSGAALLRATELSDQIPLMVLVGISVAAWMIGFFSFITPGGLGVREAVFAGFLMLHTGHAEAVACALLFRLMWTFVEWCGVAVGAFLRP